MAEAAPPNAQRTPPLDSAEGWRNVIVGFTSMFVVFGVAYSFGAFFEPMAAEFGAGAGATSVVFSITACCWFLLGSLSGRAVDRYGPRPVLLTGAVVMGLGLALTANVDRLWIGYITYGLGVGVGVACGYVPMVAVVGGWFQRRRGVALGIAVAGIGVGTLVGAPAAAALIDSYGWRTTYLAYAVLSTVVLLACAVVASAPPTPPAGSGVSLGAAVRSPAFRWLYVSTLLISLALFVPFVFLPSFAAGQGAGRVAAATLVGLIGMASVAGRLVTGVLADRLGSVRMYQACFALMALSYGIWLTTSAYGWLVFFALVLGVGYGGFIALSPAVVAELFGVRGLGGLVGLLYTAAGIGALLGPPTAGVVIDATATYRLAIGASLLAATGSFAALLPLSRRVALAADEHGAARGEGERDSAA